MNDLNIKVKSVTLAERRQREKDRRRDDIINAASRLFSKKGYDGVSMEEIANEVELSKSTLYFYFKDKDSLFFAVVNYGTKIFRSIVKEEEERMQTAGVKVGVIKTAGERFALEYPDYARAYFYFRSGKFEFSNDIDMNTDAKEVFKFTKDFFEKRFLEIKTGIENGTYRSDLDPFLVTALFVLLHNSLSTISPDLRELLNAQGITVPQFFRTVMEYLDFLILNS
jgi:TetR/AcrR family transcriptional regulator